MAIEPRLAVDIGGTFTDLVLETASGLRSLKVLTTPEAPEVGVLNGVSRLLIDTGVPADCLMLAIHGTTLATNALIERKGAKTALLTTEGFRDSLAIAYEHRFEQYDLYMERPPPLVPRELRFTVPERLAADGEVLLPLNETAVAALVPELRSAGVNALAICFLHSYVDAAHERKAGEILARAMPELSITLSAEVCPEIREYERSSTACANAYVQPLMAGYLGRLEAGLASQGIKCPLLLMMSSGGITTVKTAREFPIRLVESGPAGGVILARDVAEENHAARALSFDMGGTTAKLTLIDDYEPQHSRSFEVARAYRFLKGSGLALRVPVIDMVEIGAGGGSIARVDELKRITVGPDSAGAVPGPVCYAQGGTAPTVTDADVALGRIDPENFAGGRMPLDSCGAARAVRSHIGQQLELSIDLAAAGIAEIVDETMANAARVHAVENGKDTSDRVLVAFGGAAPLHAARLAEKLGISRVIVPAGAGVGSAHGFLRAPLGYEVVRTRLSRLSTFAAEDVNSLFSEMRAEAEAVVRLGAPTAHLKESRAAFMRYRGQGHEITVPLEIREYGSGDRSVFTDLFEERYRALFGRVIPKLEIEILTWTLSLATERVPVREAANIPIEKNAAGPIQEGARDVFDPRRGSRETASVFARSALAAGSAIAGPALITEEQTTTLVPRGFSAWVNSLEQIVIDRMGTS